MVRAVRCDLVVCWSVGCTGRLVLVDTGTARLGHGSDCSQDTKQIIPHIEISIFVL
jgi:hypothetical protein